MKTTEDNQDSTTRLAGIREELDQLTPQLLEILAKRRSLVLEVARIKHAAAQTIHVPDREAKIFHGLLRQCETHNLDYDFVTEIFALLIAHAKDAECDELGMETFLETVPVSPDVLRTNLLALTRATAPEYSPEYCQGSGADAIRSYLELEKKVLITTIGELPREGRDLALDLGCATGNVSEVLQEYFPIVKGYDLSEDMVNHARTSRTWKPHVSFHTHDLETGIPVKDGTVAFVVSSFGAASEVSPNILPEIARVLQPGGSALLSFSNAEAISNCWYYPWPSTLRAHLNTYNNTLEVWYRDGVYVVPSRGMTSAQIKEEALAAGLIAEGCKSHPTMLSILPRFAFTSPRFQQLVQRVTKLDDEIAHRGAYHGTYLLCVVRKPGSGQLPSPQGFGPSRR